MSRSYVRHVACVAPWGVDTYSVTLAPVARLQWRLEVRTVGGSRVHGEYFAGHRAGAIARRNELATLVADVSATGWAAVAA